MNFSEIWLERSERYILLKKLISSNKGGQKRVSVCVCVYMYTYRVFYRMMQTEVGASGSSVFVKGWRVVCGRTSSWPWWGSSSWWGRRSVGLLCPCASRYTTHAHTLRHTHVLWWVAQRICAICIGMGFDLSIKEKPHPSMTTNISRSMRNNICNYLQILKIFVDVKGIAQNPPKCLSIKRISSI
jgi:hypothetical protein